jgi:diaminohydroxyphosphoribosylaminopyrimidine deaminase/5-amino-6-(5-phosphoribosylamino)uracil reductase
LNWNHDLAAHVHAACVIMGPMPDQSQCDHHFLHVAARLALRGHGGAEPNPLVGCVIVDDARHVAGWGYHRRCGGPHAEIHALRRAGDRARGATAYVTLEPCNHTGRTGPCTGALIDAQVKRVVVARRDPNPVAAGGLDRLREAGIDVCIIEDCDAALAITDNFARRVRSGLPWIIAKWAQTIDGRVATRTGESRWISAARSRRFVHRQRGRVDAILTGIGTVQADDPLLTARDVRVRRPAIRVVIDPTLQIALTSKLVQTARDVPLIVVCGDGAAPATIRALRDAGAIAWPTATTNDGTLQLAEVLRRLSDEHDVCNVLTECGPRLLGRLFAARLVNDALVFIAPLLLGDAEAVACVRGMTVPRLTQGTPMRLMSSRRRGDDLMLHYRISDR